MRLLFLVVTFCLLQPGPIPADRLKSFPGFNRGDPKIQTIVFVYMPHLIISDKRVGVLPFDLPADGEPQAPPFGAFLQQALLESEAARSVSYIPSLPWAKVPAWKLERWTEADRISVAAQDGRARGLDYVAIGRVDSLFRTASHGLQANVTLWLISSSDGRVAWYGAKKAVWLRRYPTEECLLRLAWSFVTEWRAPKP